MVANGLGFAVALYRQLTQPETSATAWINVVLLPVFTVLYAGSTFQPAANRR